MSDVDTLSDEALAKLSFEEALVSLEKIVGELEAGRAGLERSIALYNEGARLKKHCEAKLGDARARIDKITVDEVGRLKATTADELTQDA